MMKTALYKIFPNEKIIVEYLSGSITWSDLVEMKRLEVNEPNYSPDYNVITDIRDTDLDLGGLDDISLYIDFLKSNSKSVGTRKSAILTNSSEQVIFSEFLRVMKDDLPLTIRSFSTLEAAFTWANLKQSSFWNIYKSLEGIKTTDFQAVAN